MSWTDPAGHVFAAGEIVTAATLNSYVKDDLIDLDRRTSPAAQYIAADEGTTSASYTNLTTAGPAVAVVIGSTGKCLVSMYTTLYNTVAGDLAAMSYALSGATTRAALDIVALSFCPSVAGTAGGSRLGATIPDFGLAAGSTTFTAKYAALTGGTAHFTDRRLVVTPLGS